MMKLDFKKMKSTTPKAFDYDSIEYLKFKFYFRCILNRNRKSRGFNRTADLK